MRQNFVPRQRGAVVLLTSMLLVTTATGALGMTIWNRRTWMMLAAISGFGRVTG